MCSPVFLFCISKTIVTDRSELNTVKQGREEWRSKCSKISVGRKRSRQNFFFSTRYLNVPWHFFFGKKKPIFFCFPHHSVADYWKPFPRGLGCCLRDSVLFVCSVLKELWRYCIHKHWVGSWKSNGFIGFQLAMMPPLNRRQSQRSWKGKYEWTRRAEVLWARLLSGGPSGPLTPFFTPFASDRVTQADNAEIWPQQQFSSTPKDFHRLRKISFSPLQNISLRP